MIFNYTHRYIFSHALVSFIFISIKLDLTTLFDEQKEDNRQTTTVTLTSHNFHRLTTPNVYTSSSSSSSSSSPTTMRTKQQTERISSSAPTMKPYPLSHGSVNEPSSVSTTLQTSTSNQASTLILSNRRPSQPLITTNGELLTAQNERIQTADTRSPTTQDAIRTTEKDLDEVQTSSSSTSMTSAVYGTSTGRKTAFVVLLESTIEGSSFHIGQDHMSSMPEETSFTTFINLYFDLQSSTMTTTDATETTTFVAKHHSLAHTVPTSKKNSSSSNSSGNDDDIMDDLLLS